MKFLVLHEVLSNGFALSYIERSYTQSLGAIGASYDIVIFSVSGLNLRAKAPFRSLSYLIVNISKAELILNFTYFIQAISP